MTNKELLNRDIKNLDDVKRWFTDLHESNFIFHPDDRACDYSTQSGEPTFTPEECDKYEKLMDQVFEVTDDPYTIELEIVHPGR